MIPTKYTQNISQPTQKELFYNKWLYENMTQLIMLMLKLELCLFFSFFDITSVASIPRGLSH